MPHVDEQHGRPDQLIHLSSLRTWQDSFTAIGYLLSRHICWIPVAYGDTAYNPATQATAAFVSTATEEYQDLTSCLVYVGGRREKICKKATRSHFRVQDSTHPHKGACCPSVPHAHPFTPVQGRPSRRGRGVVFCCQHSVSSSLRCVLAEVSVL